MELYPSDSSSHLPELPLKVLYTVVRSYNWFDYFIPSQEENSLKDMSIAEY